MLKLIIIDDEIEQVRGIRTIIPWQKHDIKVCATAQDGLEGLEKITALQPDLAIIDIHMPRLSGLELITKIREQKADIQIIILTGYDDFDYTQQAIRLAVSNYLLKPCSAEEILQAVLIAKNQVLERQALQAELLTHRELAAENRKLNRERFLHTLVENRLRRPWSFYEDQKTYGLHLPAAPSCLAVLRIMLGSGDAGPGGAVAASTASGTPGTPTEPSTPGTPNNQTHSDREQLDLYYLQLEEQITKRASETSLGSAAEPQPNTPQLELFRKEDDLLLIAQGTSPDELQQFLVSLTQETQEAMPFCLSGGIGLSVESPLDLPKSWKEALAALENAIFMGEEKISLFSESLLPQNYDLLYPVQEERRLFALLALGDREQISREQKAFFTLLAQYPLSESMIRQTALSFVKQLLLYRADHLPLADVDAAEMSRKIDTLIHSASLDELERNLTRIFADILDAQTKLPAANAYVREAIRYIEANYQDPINLHSVASALNLSPTYLSALFKQEMNINFIDYLNHYRMDKAKALLSTRGKRIYEVASDVGLQDEKYFFKLFKRYTGLTPAQYRDSMHLMDSV